MSMHRCYGCQELKDSDEGCEESKLAPMLEHGENKFQLICEDCYQSEMEEIEAHE